MIEHPKICNNDREQPFNPGVEGSNPSGRASSEGLVN